MDKSLEDTIMDYANDESCLEFNEEDEIQS